MNIQITSIRLLFSLILSVSFTTVCSALQDSNQDRKSEIDLWPTGLPADAVKLDPKKIDELKSKQAQDTRGILLYVDSPTLTVYPAAKDKQNGCAVVICPGGGYNILAWQHEGVEVAKWFNSIGVTAFVLKYRVPRRDAEKIHWEPMQDVQRAIRLVRHNAKDWNIDPNRIGTLGFSAGGHLTVMSGTQCQTVSYDPIDEADKESCRPDFMCPIYAAYLGEKYQDNVVELGSLVNVTKDTPPTFLAVTADDNMRGAQSALLFAELNRNKVPAEVHVYSKGGHGYGIRDSGLPVNQWHHQLEAWLKVNGFLTNNN